VNSIGAIIKEIIISYLIAVLEIIIRPLLEQMNKQMGLEWNLAEQVLEQMLKRFDAAYICIDALDECEDVQRRKVIDLLHRIAKSTRSISTHAPCIELFITSRQTMEKKINETYGIDSSLLLSVTLEANTYDIVKFVNHKIEMDNILQMPEHFKERIISSITEKSRGMLVIVQLFSSISHANLLYLGYY
jgi:hypothetical protein